MSVEKIASALRSKTRQKIIQLLSTGPKTPIEIYEKLGSARPKYRQSVNKSLEQLKEAGLVEKYYDDNLKKIFYKQVCSKIVIDLERMTVEYL